MTYWIAIRKYWQLQSKRYFVWKCCRRRSGVEGEIDEDPACVTGARNSHTAYSSSWLNAGVGWSAHSSVCDRALLIVAQNNEVKPELSPAQCKWQSGIWRCQFNERDKHAPTGERTADNRRLNYLSCKRAANQSCAVAENAVSVQIDEQHCYRAAVRDVAACLKASECLGIQ